MDSGISLPFSSRMNESLSGGYFNNQKCEIFIFVLFDPFNLSLSFYVSILDYGDVWHGP